MTVVYILLVGFGIIGFGLMLDIFFGNGDFSAAVNDVFAAFFAGAVLLALIALAAFCVGYPIYMAVT